MSGGLESCGAAATGIALRAGLGIRRVGSQIRGSRSKCWSKWGVARRASHFLDRGSCGAAATGYALRAGLGIRRVRFFLAKSYPRGLPLGPAGFAGEHEQDARATFRGSHSLNPGSCGAAATGIALRAGLGMRIPLRPCGASRYALRASPDKTPDTGVRWGVELFSAGFTVRGRRLQVVAGVVYPAATSTRAL